MAKKTIKKVDYKKMEKMSVKESIQFLFEDLGFMVNDGKEIYGFTDGTLVVAMDKCDIQIKLISPKSGIDRYEKLEEEMEEEVISQEEPKEEETGDSQEEPKEEEIPNEEETPENGNEEEIIQ